MNARSMFVQSFGAALASTLALGQAGQLRGMAETYQRNREELKHYSWVSRTEVIVDGEVIEKTLARMRFDGEGNLEETSIADTPDEKRRGKRRTARQAKKVAKLHRKLRELIHSYTRFTAGQMDSVFGRSSVFPGEGDAEGTIRIQARSIVREGDTMSIWADSLDKRLRRFEIVTSLEGEPVKVITVFRDLPDGPTYPAITTVETEVKRRTTIIKMENFDYIRRSD